MIKGKKPSTSKDNIVNLSLESLKKCNGGIIVYYKEYSETAQGYIYWGKVGSINDWPTVPNICGSFLDDEDFISQATEFANELNCNPTVYTESQFWQEFNFEPFPQNNSQGINGQNANSQNINVQSNLWY